MDKEDIRNIREGLGLTQGQFAEKIGVNLRTVQNYESGKTSPTVDIIMKMFNKKVFKKLLYLLKNPDKLDEYLNSHEG